MKLFKLALIFFLVIQIFATPVIQTCLMAEEMAISCCPPQDCECDDISTVKTDHLQQQVKEFSVKLKFNFDLPTTFINPVSFDFKEPLFLKEYSFRTLFDSRKIRTHYQVFLI